MGQPRESSRVTLTLDIILTTPVLVPITLSLILPLAPNLAHSPSHLRYSPYNSYPHHSHTHRPPTITHPLSYFHSLTHSPSSSHSRAARHPSTVTRGKARPIEQRSARELRRLALVVVQHAALGVGKIPGARGDMGRGYAAVGGYRATE